MPRKIIISLSPRLHDTPKCPPDTLLKASAHSNYRPLPFFLLILQEPEPTLASAFFTRSQLNNDAFEQVAGFAL